MIRNTKNQTKAVFYTYSWKGSQILEIEEKQRYVPKPAVLPEKYAQNSLMEQETNVYFNSLTNIMAEKYFYKNRYSSEYYPLQFGLLSNAKREYRGSNLFCITLLPIIFGAKWTFPSNRQGFTFINSSKWCSGQKKKKNHVNVSITTSSV